MREAKKWMWCDVMATCEIKAQYGGGGNPRRVEPQWDSPPPCTP
jgi:hypothetical protein